MSDNIKNDVLNIIKNNEKVDIIISDKQTNNDLWWLVNRFDLVESINCLLKVKEMKLSDEEEFEIKKLIDKYVEERRAKIKKRKLLNYERYNANELIGKEKYLPIAEDIRERTLNIIKDKDKKKIILFSKLCSVASWWIINKFDLKNAINDELNKSHRGLSIVEEIMLDKLSSEILNKSCEEAEGKGYVSVYIRVDPNYEIRPNDDNEIFIYNNVLHKNELKEFRIPVVKLNEIKKEVSEYKGILQIIEKKESLKSLYDEDSKKKKVIKLNLNLHELRLLYDVAENFSSHHEAIIEAIKWLNESMEKMNKYKRKDIDI